MTDAVAGLSESAISAGSRAWQWGFATSQLAGRLQMAFITDQPSQIVSYRVEVAHVHIFVGAKPNLIKNSIIHFLLLLLLYLLETYYYYHYNGPGYLDSYISYPVPRWYRCTPRGSFFPEHYNNNRLHLDNLSNTRLIERWSTLMHFLNPPAKKHRYDKKLPTNKLSLTKSVLLYTCHS